MTTSERYLAFMDFLLDPENACLWRGSDAIKLKPKAFEVLRYLVEHPGRLVSKDDLWRAVWPDVAVTDGVLAVCLTQIRQALGDNARDPRFIETVHRRGYRFIAPLTTTLAQREASPPVSVALRSPLSTARLVGREAELTQLHAWLDKALNGERQIVFVTGEPGIGKTALIEAFLQSLGSRVQSLESEGQKPLLSEVWTLDPRHQTLNTLLWISRGQCIEHYGAGEAYLPVLQALEELGQGAEAEHDFLLTVLRQYAPSWLRQLPALVSPTEREALQQQTAGVTRERMLRELVAALEALTAHQSLVLVLEDLHWSDPSTVDFLALLARRQGPARLLVIGTYRPVDVIVSGHPLKGMKQELQMHGQCQELSLRLLSEGAVADYLAMRLPPEATHAQASLSQLARTIHQRTDGNPLFMVTVTNYALAQEVKSAGGESAPDDFVRLLDTVPVELQQMITRQVEALTPEDQHLLDTASVVGAEFSAAAVAPGVGEDLITVEGQCERLARRGHVLQARGTAVWPDGTVAGRYGFLHALYQEVLYERLPAGRRRQVVVISAPQKHHHVYDPVVGYLFDAALDLWSLGYPDQALKKGHEALTLAREMSHPFSLALALHFAAELHILCREVQAVQDLAEELITLSTEQGFSYRAAAGTIFRGWVLSEQGQGEEGIIQIHKGLAALRATGAGISEPFYLTLLAAAYAQVGRIGEGLALLDEALALINKTGERVSEAGLYMLKGWLTLQSQASPEEVSGKSKASQNAKRKTQRLPIATP